MSSAIKWTQMQDQAITARGADLLVSASAGSGKTAVMIERITSMIVSREASADRVLVLTFTKESANDMRAKLRARLEKELANAKDDKDYLTQQINTLPIAGIGTFHAFCNKLITTHFNVVGIDPAFQILDTVGAAALRSEVLDEIIAANYDECSEAIDVFCANRNTERLKEIIISIKEPFLNSRADAEEWLKTTAFAGYNQKLNDNPAMKQILEHYNVAGNYYLKKFKDCEITAQAEEVTKLQEIIKRDIIWAHKLAQAGSYKNLHDFALSAALNPLNKGIWKKERDCSIYQVFKTAHGEFKELIYRIAEHYSITEEQMLRNQEKDKRIVTQVIKLVREFSAMYLARKAGANKLDYSDLESYAVRLLEEPSIAASVRAKYKFIFIDEYQDTNPMQEKILSLVGRESKIFMVGDVKQSIYGFRGCEPTIFAGKITDFETQLSGKVVKLNENFRSNPAILSFVNCVFSKIMRGDIAGINYSETSKFLLHEHYPVPSEEAHSAVEVILVDTTKEKGEREEITEVYDITQDKKSDSETKAAQAEAALIAEKIFQYAKTQIWNAREKKFQKVNLSDIAILTRRKDDFKVLLEMFKKAGIDAAVQGEQNAAELFEIALLNNMLLATSNFYNDVPLVLLMQSFVFGFTPNELAEISTYGDRTKRISFFKRIKNYSEAHTNELAQRLNVFLEFLNRYHRCGLRENVVDVITRFLTEFRIINTLLTTSAGDMMVQNIYAFLNKLRGQSYAASVAGYVFALENGTLELNIGTGTSGGDCVQIMTMHGAKGLEWPIVILFNMGAAFNSADARKFMVVDKQCGLCVYSTDTDEFVKTNSIARLGAAISAERVLVAEELRLFYVALTRAKNHLLIVGSANVGNLLPDCEDYDIICAKNYLQFLAPTISDVNKCDFIRRTVQLSDIKIKSYDTKGRVLSGKHDEKRTRELREIFSREYSHKKAAAQVLKNSVSSLTKREEEVIDFKPFQAATCDRGAEYGTHFHNLMQRADFKKVNDNANDDVRHCVEIIEPLVSGMKIFRELPFLQKTEKNGAQILVQGVIDLLAVSNDRAILVDYKTTNASVKKLIEIYTPQLSMYAAAVRQALQQEEVDVYIYSTVHRRLIKI